MPEDDFNQQPIISISSVWKIFYCFPRAQSITYRLKLFPASCALLEISCFSSAVMRSMASITAGIFCFSFVKVNYTKKWGVVMAKSVPSERQEFAGGQGRDGRFGEVTFVAGDDVGAPGLLRVGALADAMQSHCHGNVRRRGRRRDKCARN